eukprot:240294_1
MSQQVKSYKTDVILNYFYGKDIYTFSVDPNQFSNGRFIAYYATLKSASICDKTKMSYNEKSEWNAIDKSTIPKIEIGASVLLNIQKHFKYNSIFRSYTRDMMETMQKKGEYTLKVFDGQHLFRKDEYILIQKDVEHLEKKLNKALNDKKALVNLLNKTLNDKTELLNQISKLNDKTKLQKKLKLNEVLRDKIKLKNNDDVKSDIRKPFDQSQNLLFRRISITRINNNKIDCKNRYPISGPTPGAIQNGEQGANQELNSNKFVMNECDIIMDKYKCYALVLKCMKTTYGDEWQKYLDIFVEDEVDDEAFINIDKSDLRTMGIKTGKRIKIKTWLDEYKQLN